ncbi:unnamed protein product [Cunninghamella echinulata]
MKLTLFISSALVALASAQSSIIYVTSPAGGETYTAGTDAVITWDKPNVDTIGEIVLTQGDPKALDHLDIIANDINASDREFTWKIPSDLPPGDYAFQFGAEPNFAYSGKFTVEAGESSQETEGSEGSEGSEVTEASEEGGEVEGGEEA